MRYKTVIFSIFMILMLDSCLMVPFGTESKVEEHMRVFYGMESGEDYEFVSKQKTGKDFDFDKVVVSLETKKAPLMSITVLMDENLVAVTDDYGQQMVNYTGTRKLNDELSQLSDRIICGVDFLGTGYEGGTVDFETAFAFKRVQNVEVHAWLFFDFEKEKELSKSLMSKTIDFFESRGLKKMSIIYEYYDLKRHKINSMKDVGLPCLPGLYKSSEDEKDCIFMGNDPNHHDYLWTVGINEGKSKDVNELIRSARKYTLIKDNDGYEHYEMIIMDKSYVKELEKKREQDRLANPDDYLDTVLGFTFGPCDHLYEYTRWYARGDGKHLNSRTPVYRNPSDTAKIIKYYQFSDSIHVIKSCDLNCGWNKVKWDRGKGYVNNKDMIKWVKFHTSGTPQEFQEGLIIDLKNGMPISMYDDDGYNQNYEEGAIKGNE